MLRARRQTTTQDRSEEAGALVGAILAVTASGALMIAMFQAVAGMLPLIAGPGAAVVGALALGRERTALWAGAAVWIVIAPLAPGIGLVAPLLMIAVCVTFAVGTERVLEWIAREWSGIAPDADPTQAGWIEDDPGVG